MSVEVALLISIVSVAFSIFFGLKNNKRSDNKDIAKDAEEKAETKIMLRQISGDVSEMKNSFTVMRDDVRQLTERMVIVEQSVKSAHKRVDDLTINKEVK